MTVEAFISALSQEAQEALASYAELSDDKEAVQRAQARVRERADEAAKALLALKRAREEETAALEELGRRVAQRRQAFRDDVLERGGFTMAPTFEPQSPDHDPPASPGKQ